MEKLMPVSEQHVAYKKELAAFRSRITDQAKHIVMETMPSKIIKLNRLLESPEMQMAALASENADLYGVEFWGTSDDERESKGSDPDEMRVSSNGKRKSPGTEPAGKKAHLTGGAMLDPVPVDQSKCAMRSNPIASRLIPMVKQEVLDLMKNLSTVKVWLSYQIPKQEDGGNNSGVMLLEEVVSMLARAEDSSFSILESISDYFSERAKHIGKLKKLEGKLDMAFDDMRRSLIEVDERQVMNLRVCLLDIRNNYAALEDMISKNVEKILVPRPASHSFSNYM